MIRLITSAMALGVLTSCGVGPAFEDTRPMETNNNMLTQTIAAATCTRGEKPFNLTVAPDGTATGRLVAPDPPKGQKRAVMPEFPASLKATDRKTVVLVVGPDIVTRGAVSEPMSAVLKNAEAILRGDSFDCTDVLVRPAA